MSSTVNYYHYSVYKLLLVNLGCRRHGGLLAKKIGSGKPRGTARMPTSAMPAKTPKIFRLRPCRRTSLHGDVDNARTWRQSSRWRHENRSHVDKPMHIHRIECAKPARSGDRNFLSSFDPCRIQVFSSAFTAT
jgi:hypothetical protein